MLNTPWNNPNYPSLDFTNHKVYSKNHNQQPVELKNSEILFVGSCDISGDREDRYWHEIYCETVGINHDDYVKIGSIGQPMEALIRKIYAYLKSVDLPPKKIFMVAPICTPEYIMNDMAYPVPRDLDSIQFLERLNLIPPTVLYPLSNLIFALRGAVGPGQITYDFLKNYSFLEVMMKAYAIELYWTPNLTRKANAFYKNLDSYLEKHDYAKKTFIGYDPATIKFNADSLDYPSKESHQCIANLFLSIRDK